MKHLVISCAVLALLLAASLWNARAIRSEVEPWCETVENAREAASREDWEEARSLTDAFRRAWDARQTYYHIVIEHDELDSTEELLERAVSAIESRDGDSFRAEAGALIAQLRVIAEMQELTIRNIL